MSYKVKQMEKKIWSQFSETILLQENPRLYHRFPFCLVPTLEDITQLILTPNRFYNFWVFPDLF